MPIDNMSDSQIGNYESLIDGLMTQNFGLVDNFLSEDLVVGLRNNLIKLYDHGKMHPAGIGKRFSYQRNLKVRGDQIFWIDKHSNDPYEQNFVEQIQAFVEYLNRTCYTGINDFEFHYAYYEEGSFYKRHLDQFKVDQGRKFSLVTYLNDQWLETDGGKLSLYLDDQEISAFPLGGRAVFFKSDEVEHEVHAAVRPRMSIAGWLKVHKP